MPCFRHVFCIAIFICFLDVIVSLEEAPEDPPKDGPVPRSQLMYLASDVCSELLSETTECQDNFTNSTANVALEPPKIKFQCRTKSKAKYALDPIRDMQLLLLIPDNENGTIRSKISRASDRTSVIEYINSYNYTFWATTLQNDGTHSEWRKGPDLLPWKGNGINITIGESNFEYIGNRKQYYASFRIDIVGEINPCTTLDVVNICKNTGYPFDKKFMPNTTANQAAMKILINDLQINDECSLEIYANDNYETLVSKKTYLTPVPGEIHLPEKAENVTLDAMATAAGWDIKMTWNRPKRYPIQYNLTFRAHDIVYRDVVSGLETSHTFMNVKGEEGANFNVSIVSITPNGTAQTARLGNFPARPRSFQAVIVTWFWIVMLMVASTALGALAWWRRRRIIKNRKRYFTPPGIKLPKECLMESCPEPGVEDGWELRSERILLHEVIGEGAFGVVRRGTLAPGGREVAVKMLKDFPTTEEVRSFRAEMELMKSVGSHSHIVSLVGCCTGRRPLIVAEYCSRGDLLSFLRCSWDVMVSKRNAKYYNNNLEGSDYRNDLFKKQKDPKLPPLVVNKLYDLQGLCDSELTPLDLLSFCRQIAMGMEFLASNRVVHRDLAARNILVTGDRTLKIADFGLSRDVYQENQYKQKGNGKMPVKWMALESLTHRIYTTQSDVWSFGVVIWEVVTVGGAPYPEVAAARLPRLLRAGYRMPRPNNCSKQLYDLMMSCWRARPRERPTFAELHHQLDELLNSACADEYLSLELDCEPPPTPKPQRYIRMILRGNRVWVRGESYERPLKCPQINHYTTPPHSTNAYQPMKAT